MPITEVPFILRCVYGALYAGKRASGSGQKQTIQLSCVPCIKSRVGGAHHASKGASQSSSQRSSLCLVPPPLPLPQPITTTLTLLPLSECRRRKLEEGEGVLHAHPPWHALLHGMDHRRGTSRRSHSSLLRKHHSARLRILIHPSLVDFPIRVTVSHLYLSYTAWTMTSWTGSIDKDASWMQSWNVVLPVCLSPLGSNTHSYSMFPQVRISIKKASSCCSSV